MTAVRTIGAMILSLFIITAVASMASAQLHPPEVKRAARRAVSVDESAARCAEFWRGAGLRLKGARRRTAAAAGHVYLQGFLQR